MPMQGLSNDPVSPNRPQGEFSRLQIQPSGFPFVDSPPEVSGKRFGKPNQSFRCSCSRRMRRDGRQLFLRQLLNDGVTSIKPSKQIDFPTAFTAKRQRTSRLRRQHFSASGHSLTVIRRECTGVAAGLRLSGSGNRLVTDRASQRSNHGCFLLEAIGNGTNATWLAPVV